MPIAALTLLNDPTFLEAARGLAAIAFQQAGADDERLKAAWRRVLSRDGQPEELQELERLLHSSRIEFGAKPEAATKLLSIGMYRPPQQLNAVELAAWTTVCRVLLNLHETITRE